MEKSTARESLARYLHYFERYVAHSDSLKKTETKESIQRKIAEVRTLTPNSAWVMNEWIENAAEALNVARRTLMYSYAMAFYLFDHASTDTFTMEGYQRFNEEQVKIAKEMFEDKQENLETVTEALSGMLEDKAEKLASDEELQRCIMSHTTLCDSYVRALIDMTRQELMVDPSVIPPLQPILHGGHRFNRSSTSIIFTDDKEMTTKVSGQDDDDDDDDECTKDENKQHSHNEDRSGIVPDYSGFSFEEDDIDLQLALLESMSNR